MLILVAKYCNISIPVIVFVFLISLDYKSKVRYGD